MGVGEGVLVMLRACGVDLATFAVLGVVAVWVAVLVTVTFWLFVCLLVL